MGRRVKGFVSPEVTSNPVYGRDVVRKQFLLYANRKVFHGFYSNKSLV